MIEKKMPAFWAIYWVGID